MKILAAAALVLCGAACSSQSPSDVSATSGPRIALPKGTIVYKIPMVLVTWTQNGKDSAATYQSPVKIVGAGDKRYIIDAHGKRSLLPPGAVVHHSDAGAVIYQFPGQPKPKIVIGLKLRPSYVVR